MSEIEKEASLVEVATIVSDALRKAGIAATLSGGGAVSNQILDWEALRTWFANEGIPNPEFERFRSASRST